jgi:hypothetical protein
MRPNNAHRLAMLRNRAAAGSDDAAELFAAFRLNVNPADAALLGHRRPG